MSLRDVALAELAKRRAANDTAAARAALVSKARTVLGPVLTDTAGVVALDPATMDPKAANLDRQMVVLAATDGSNLFFAVNMDVTPPRVFLVVPAPDNGWTQAARVESLADVGFAIEAGKV